MSWTDEQLTAWGNRYGMDLATVKRLRYWCNKYATQNEHWCNGDDHWKAPKGDKTACQLAWEREMAHSEREILAIANKYDMKVDWGVGLMPVFEKDGDSCIHVPE